MTTIIRRSIGRYGPECYSRNPYHYAEFEHPWLVPMGALCKCGRPAGADGWCCSACAAVLPDFELYIEDGSRKVRYYERFKGKYRPAGTANGSPKWQSATASLYRTPSGLWNFELRLGCMEGCTTGYIAGNGGDSSHPDTCVSWQTHDGAHWVEGVKVELRCHRVCSHTKECSARKDQAAQLANQVCPMAARI